MKILVTGGAGFIGSNFIRHVLASGKDYMVVNYDKLTYAGNVENLASVANNPGYLFVKGDSKRRCVIAAPSSQSYYERYYGNRDSSLLEIARSKPGRLDRVAG